VPVLPYAFFILMKMEVIVKRLYEKETKERYGVGEVEGISFVWTPNISPFCLEEVVFVRFVPAFVCRDGWFTVFFVGAIGFCVNVTVFCVDCEETVWVGSERQEELAVFFDGSCSQ